MRGASGADALGHLARTASARRNLRPSISPGKRTLSELPKRLEALEHRVSILETPQA